MPFAAYIHRHAVQSFASPDAAKAGGMMIGNSSATAGEPVPVLDVFRAAAAVAGKGEYGTLVLDGLGRICSCGTAAGQIFGSSFSDLAGRSIASLVSDFAVSGSSLSYSARYFAHLCADSGWRKFNAVDVHGQQFPVELTLCRMRTDGQDFFLLNLRRLDAA
jgi:hypothetical protein